MGLNTQTATQTMPDWFWDLIEVFIETPEFKEDTVYNIYKCGKCILEHFEDQARADRRQFVSGAGRDVIVCRCTDKKSRFFCKYKICSECGNEFFGTRVLPGPCGKCLKSTRKPQKKGKKVILVQRGEVKEIPRSEAPEPYTEPDCVHRSKCLEIAFSDHRELTLYCKDCPDFQKDERRLNGFNHPCSLY